LLSFIVLISYFSREQPEMKILFLIGAVIFTLFAFTSCMKETAGNNNSRDVYVMGRQAFPATNFPRVTTVWKNGIPIEILDSANGFTGSYLAVSGSDIYVIGWEGLTSDYVFYKNGIRNMINGGPSSSTVSLSMAVSGSDVYIAGLSDTLASTYFKNGVPVYMKYSLSGTNTTSSGTVAASQIVVQGNDVYLTGTVGDTAETLPLLTFIPASWKNSKLNLLESSVTTSISWMTVSGTDVYISGNGNSAMYWKNGVPVYLGAGVTTCIAVSGSDVYVSGNSNNGEAIYWKNGNSVLLASNAITTGIIVSGNDVYISGNEGQYAVYWKNGITDTLCSGIATSISFGN
jgi:hypothetical protein